MENFISLVVGPLAHPVSQSEIVFSGSFGDSPEVPM